MIGLDFPVKPAWIHDVLRLWRPDQPISDLVHTALAQTMTELGGEKTRRNSLTVILRYFVPTVGGGQTRRTTRSNVWAAYVAQCSEQIMASVYLAQITAHNTVALDVSQFITRRGTIGSIFASTELRRHVITRYGQRKVVTNSASAFLRTLQHFGVLDSGQRTGDYHFVGILSVAQPVFPLLVWVWWQAHGAPQIDLDGFAADPTFGFLDTTHFFDLWLACQSTFWVLDDRLGQQRATLKSSDPEVFQARLLRSLAISEGEEGEY